MTTPIENQTSKPPQKPPSQGGGGNNRPRNRRGGRGGHRKPRKQQSKATPEELAAAAAKAEEERLKKEEEERLRLIKEEEERKAQELLELRRQTQDAMDVLDGWSKGILEHDEMRSRLAPTKSNDLESSVIMNPWLLEARKKHLNSKKSLKSDLKKCTAFVKKVKTLAGAANGAAKEAVCKSLVNEIQTLNLSRYIDEIAVSIYEAKFKISDVPYLCSVVVAMHERYEDFVPALLNPIQEFLKGKIKENVELKESTKQRRVFLRILTDLLLNGVIVEFKLLLRVLSEAAGVRGKYSSEAVYQVVDATLLVSFAKAVGVEMIGKVPKSVRSSVAVLEKVINASVNGALDSDLLIKVKNTLQVYQKASQQRAVPLETLSTIGILYDGIYKSITQSLIDTHGKLRKLEKRCEQDKLLNGSITESREKGLADAQKLFENLFKSVESLSEILDKDAPTLECEQEEFEAYTRSGLELWTKTDDNEELNWFPFDDEETWSFYVDIPDFLTTVPSVLLGLSDDQVESKKADNSKKYGLDTSNNPEELSEDQHSTIPIISDEGVIDVIDEAEMADDNEDLDVDKDTPHYKLMILLSEELPEIHSREKSDNLAEKFIVNHGSNKNSRRRLVKALFQVPRTRLDLLPYYSRILASLDRVFDDVAVQVVRDLESQFHGCARFKKNLNIEGRIKNARFIGELTKFRVAPPIVALRALQRCLEDFSGVNIDVACCILECCGRFLHRTKFTHARLSVLMATLMRLRKAKNLDDRHQHLIDSAFYNISPPHGADNIRSIRKNLSPIEAYLKYLFMDELTPDDSKVTYVVKQLLRFPWHDSTLDCGGLVCKYMLKAVRKGRYKSSDAIAMVVERLKATNAKPEIAVRLVDAVFEGLQWALEQPNFRDQQRTISLARLLGDLYNYGILTSSSLFEELYHFIDFGHEIPESLREASRKQIDNQGKYCYVPSTNILGQTIVEDEEMIENESASIPQHISPVAVSPHARFDPRVPCVFDGPVSVLRIKLVCTVLEKCHVVLLSSNFGNIKFSQLQRFLTHFQRYLFTKSVLPTEVEFAVLDLLDSIDSVLRKTNQMKENLKRTTTTVKRSITRYKNWADAHAAAILAEETEAKHEERDKQKLLAQGGDVFESDDENDDDDSTHASLNSSVKDSSLQGNNFDECMSDSSSESDDQSIDDSISSDDDGTSDSDDSEDSDEEDSDSDEENNQVTQDEAYARQLEIESFERELRKLTLEGLEKGKASVRAGSNAGKVLDTMIHASQFASKKSETGGGDHFHKMSALDGVEGMTFKVIQRGHKGRAESKDLVIPSASNLAKQAIKQDDMQAREHDMIKAKVLQYEADSQDQDTEGNLYLGQTRLTVIRNRPLSLEEIERNFGKNGGSDGKWGSVPVRGNDTRRPNTSMERGRGRGLGGRTLRMW